MFRNIVSFALFVCFLFELSANGLEICYVPQGCLMESKPRMVTLSATYKSADEVIKLLQDPKCPFSYNLYIGLDGNVTMFEPNEKVGVFDTDVKNEQLLFNNILLNKEDDTEFVYSAIAKRLCEKFLYKTGMCGPSSYWRGVTACNSCSINIMVQESLEGGERYTSKELNIIDGLLKAFSKNGISAYDICPLSDISYKHIEPVGLMKALHEMDSEFLPWPDVTVDSAMPVSIEDLKESLSLIGYGAPLKNGKKVDEFGKDRTYEDSWVANALNAFSRHYCGGKLFAEDSDLKDLDEDKLKELIAKNPQLVTAVNQYAVKINGSVAPYFAGQYSWSDNARLVKDKIGEERFTKLATDSVEDAKEDLSEDIFSLYLGAV